MALLSVNSKARWVWFVCSLVPLILGISNDAPIQGLCMMVLLVGYGIILKTRRRAKPKMSDVIGPWIVFGLTVIAMLMTTSHKAEVPRYPRAELTKSLESYPVKVDGVSLGASREDLKTLYGAPAKVNYVVRARLVEPLEIEETVALLEIALEHNEAGQHSEECTDTKRDHVGTEQPDGVSRALKRLRPKGLKPTTELRSRLIEAYVTDARIDVKVDVSQYKILERMERVATREEPSTPTHVLDVKSYDGTRPGLLYKAEGLETWYYDQPPIKVTFWNDGTVWEIVGREVTVGEKVWLDSGDWIEKWETLAPLIQQHHKLFRTSSGRRVGEITLRGSLSGEEQAPGSQESTSNSP